MQDHSLYGYLFIRYFSPLQDLAVCVLHHHTPWNILKGMDGISDGEQGDCAAIVPGGPH